MKTTIKVETGEGGEDGAGDEKEPRIFMKGKGKAHEIGSSHKSDHSVPESNANDGITGIKEEASSSSSLDNDEISPK